MKLNKKNKILKRNHMRFFLKGFLLFALPQFIVWITIMVKLKEPLVYILTFLYTLSFGILGVILSFIYLFIYKYSLKWSKILAWTVLIFYYLIYIIFVIVGFYFREVGFPFLS